MSRIVEGIGATEEKDVLFPMLVGSGDFFYKLAMGTGAYGKGPVFVSAGIIKIKDGVVNY